MSKVGAGSLKSGRIWAHRRVGGAPPPTEDFGSPIEAQPKFPERLARQMRPSCVCCAAPLGTSRLAPERCARAARGGCIEHLSSVAGLRRVELDSVRRASSNTSYRTQQFKSDGVFAIWANSGAAVSEFRVHSEGIAISYLRDCSSLCLFRDPRISRHVFNLWECLEFWRSRVSMIFDSSRLP